MLKGERRMAPEDGALNYLLLRAALDRYQRGPGELSGDEYAVVREQAGKALELEERVLATCEADEVMVPSPVVEEAVGTIAARYPDRESFEEDLHRNALDPETLREALERELKVEAVLERVAAAAGRVSDEEVAAYYENHRSRFDLPETRTVRQILITINEDYPENARPAARERIEALARELEQAPRRFGELAPRHSECPSALKEGLLGRIRPGELFPELDAALFALPEGGLSPVIESSLGFHLLWCERIHRARTLPLEAVRDKLREKLQGRRRQAYLRAWLADTRSAN